MKTVLYSFKQFFYAKYSLIILPIIIFYIYRIKKMYERWLLLHLVKCNVAGKD
jgi:hypothetical protein